MVSLTFWSCRQSTKFQVKSDLHLETIQYEFDIPKSAPYLIPKDLITSEYHDKSVKDTDKYCSSSQGAIQCRLLKSKSQRRF